MQNCKPGSVYSPKRGAHHLSKLPTLYSFSPKRESDEPPSTCSLLGITTCKVCTKRVSPPERVSSYLTFSPLLSITRKRLFSATLSVISAFLHRYPLFLAVHCPTLPGLSSIRTRRTAIGRFALQMYSFLNGIDYNRLFTRYKQMC